jgi:hypothetical protein
MYCDPPDYQDVVREAPSRVRSHHDMLPDFPVPLDTM